MGKWVLIGTDSHLTAQSFPSSAENIQEKLSCTEGLSLTKMVSENLQKRLFRTSLETRGERCHNPDGLTCGRPHKVTKAKRF
jgi:hypothetical protein